jgi:hypothetical protein
MPEERCLRDADATGAKGRQIDLHQRIAARWL